jgi:hypothetical protein
MKRWLNGVLVMAIVACLVILTGCGGSSDGSSSGESSGSAATGSSTTASSADKGGEPSAEFAGKGENGNLAKEGKEASVADREAASKVLEESFESREAKAWAAQCGTLTAKAVKAVEEEEEAEKAKAKGCASSLESIGKTAPASVLENPMKEPIAALRIKGGEAFAFFHGKGGKDYVIPLEKEDGEWKVNALAPQGAP